MIRVAGLALLALAACADAPRFPLADGDYTFEHRYAEHPSMKSVPLDVTVRDGRIELVGRGATGAFPEGIHAEGELMWHAASQQWIIGHNKADRDAPEVGGCSDGPEVIDPVGRIYWTC